MATAEAPAHLTDTVFHVTTEDLVDSILKRGLQPNTERGRKLSWRMFERFMDDQRPDHIKARGISRRHGVFAYPEAGVIKPKWLSPKEYEAYQRSPRAETAFAIDVNPDSVLVFDMDDLEKVISGIKSQERQSLPEPDEATYEAALHYWNSGITLHDYRQYYEETHDTHFSRSQLRESINTPEGLRPIIWTPEVIVPGPVAPEAMCWAVSSIVLRDTDH